MKRRIHKALFALFSAALTAIDAAGLALSRLLPPRAVRRHRPPGRGISVIIPERANPDLLQESLRSVLEAARRVMEPVEVIVIVNGSPQSFYKHLQDRFPSVRWLFFRGPLWFGGAIREGLKVAAYDWVYLLNNDMTVDPSALAELLPWREPRVFAIASQIFFKDPSRRREETGWTRFRESDGLPEIFDAAPEDDRVRGTFYAGGGASLFQKALLRRFSRSTLAYSPFYWEDVEWGTTAWRCGFESLFCPTSIVRHHHRATNRLLFPEAEIARIFEKNRIQYELRNRLLRPEDRHRLRIHLRRLHSASLREMIRVSVAAGVLWARLKYWTYPFRDLPLQYTWQSCHLRPPSAAAEPLILMVTPYAIFPPGHGGAVRLSSLMAAISEHFNIVLLSDEAEGYTSDALRYFDRLSSVYLVSGRTNGAGGGRIGRIENHSHPDLKNALKRLVACRSPALVQIEFTELAGLIAVRRDSIPWLLTLHEVWLSERGEAASPEDRHENALLGQFDAIITCSEEDARLVNHPAVHVVPNGTDVHSTPYTPSPEAGPILFVGPFRYLPNLQGIREFLETVYPRLLEFLPDLRLWVLGGRGGRETASQIPCFRQKGVTVMDFVEQTRPYLDQCSLTINPIRGVRGSCLKVVESIAAGRVCVSTREGARGFLHLHAPALMVVESVAGFEARIRRLLCDFAFRRSCERPSPQILHECSWDAGAHNLRSAYHQWIGSSKRGRDRTDVRPYNDMG